MRKIIPFNNVLTFNTDVCEISAISLEHDIKLADDSISGVFYISGEYKITDGLLEKESFNFELPFDIALGKQYDLNTLVVDIDDFRYELVGRNELKVNIDLYIDGDIIEDPIIVENQKQDKSNEIEEDKSNIKDEIKNNDSVSDNENNEPIREEVVESLDLLDEMLENNKENKVKEEKKEKDNIDIDISNENTNDTTNENIDIFSGFNEEEKYVTYRVYRVNENDTIDNILEKYNITKEELAKYNSIESIKPGDKLIIPANDK